VPPGDGPAPATTVTGGLTLTKKGPKSGTYTLLAESLSEELVSRYLELALHVQDQELARRREIERAKAAIRRAKEAARRAAWEAACRAAGIELPKPQPRKPKAKRKSKAKGKAKVRPVLLLVLPPAVALESTPAALESTPVALACPLAAEPGPAVQSAETPAPDGDAGAAGAAGEPDAVSAAGEPDAGPRLAPKPSSSKSRNRKPITRVDILKLAIADDLGYLGKVRDDGWGGLTTAESGRVGGMMTRRMKRLEKGLPAV
jgi:hypothetical protein